MLARATASYSLKDEERRAEYETFRQHLCQEFLSADLEVLLPKDGDELSGDVVAGGKVVLSIPAVSEIDGVKIIWKSTRSDIARAGDIHHRKEGAKRATNKENWNRPDERAIGSGLWYDEVLVSLPMSSMGVDVAAVFSKEVPVKANAHARRIEHRANLRKAVAGQLGEEEAKAVLAAETARKAAIKPAAVLTRKQRKSQKAQRLAAR